MTGRFRAELAGCGVPVVELAGSHRRRLARAVAACDALLAAGWQLADPLVAAEPARPVAPTPRNAAGPPTH